MPNQNSSRQTANEFFPFSSSSIVRDAPHAGREIAVRPRKAGSDLRQVRAVAPEAIWGQFNNYRSNGLVGSAIVHVVLLALILGGAMFGHHVVEQVKQKEVVTLIAPSPDTYSLPVAKKVVSGGGGGGDHDKLQAPKGKLPKTAMQQITPPSIVLRNEHPKLAVAPTVVVPPQIHMADNHMPTLGNPSAAPMPSAPPSNGTGSGGGIGSGSGGGVGVGHGPGVGEGSGGGIGGGVFKVGGGISAPKAVSTPDPEYTEEARNAKTQGTCILWLIVDQQGNPRDIRVVRGLGYGLDARAIAAVKQWRFEPAMKDGHPVNVQISVEVGFRLY
ncbi:MAG TPA: energy transducer TonB [Candidatus Binatia bacterium]|nr:energy transducer TonB [Candidatus Binatia bacterium]